jgi:hypothetical protein
MALLNEWGVIRIEEDWKIELVAQTSHEARNLTDSDKFAFSFRDTNYYRDLQFLRGSEYRLQQN